MAFVLDEGSQSLYEYDLARRRFLGPTVRLADDVFKETGHRTLPGYPTVVFSQPGHDLAATSTHIVVAGGINGYVTVVPWTRANGLGRPRHVDIPVINAPDALEDEADVTTTVVDHVVRLGPDRALAVTSNELFKHYPGQGDEEGVGSWPYRVTGYLIDLKNVRVIKTGVLSEKPIQALAPWGESAVATASGEVIVIGPDLRIRKHFQVKGKTSDVVVIGSKAFIETYEFQAPTETSPKPKYRNARLIRLDLDRGEAREIAGAPLQGTLIASSTDIWWTYSQGASPAKLQHLRASNALTSDVKLKSDTRSVRPVNAKHRGDCNDIRSLVQVGKLILAPCSTRGRLVRIPTDGGPIMMTSAGSFPSAIVAPAG